VEFVGFVDQGGQDFGIEDGVAGAEDLDPVCSFFETHCTNFRACSGLSIGPPSH